MKQFFLVQSLLLLYSCVAYCAEPGCLKEKYHKDTPSGAGGSIYPECQPWEGLSCCTKNFTIELKNNLTRNLYNHSWDRCGQLSRKCERFWINQECFYQCSPYLIHYQHSTHHEAVYRAPICASVCDRWYEACEDDYICVENIFSDYEFTKHGHNYCPKDKPCKTYREMYGSGKNLCEKMWGDSYSYTDENFDRSNCYVMWFTGSNPNKRVPDSIDKPGGSSNFVYGSPVTVLILAFLAFKIPL